MYIYIVFTRVHVVSIVSLWLIFNIFNMCIQALWEAKLLNNKVVCKAIYEMQTHEKWHYLA